MASYEKEIAKLTAIYQEVDTDEVNEFSESDDSVADVAESDDETVAVTEFNVSEHETDTEQEYVSEEEEEIISPKKGRSLYYFGKDGTKWQKNNPPKNVRTRQQNVVTDVPGVSREAKSGKSPLQCWNYFFGDIIENIVLNTNLYIQKHSDKYKSKYDVKEASVNEIKALFGLLYLAGVQHGGRKNVTEFYSNDGLNGDVFPAAIAYRRLKFLLRCLRFDNINTRDVRRSQDKLAAVRDMMEKFNESCKKHYSVGVNATIDEMLLAFRGRCSFKMYIPNKPNKYGLKIFSLVDSKTFYTSLLEIYAGTQPDGPFKIENSGAAVVERMCSHISGSGRNITMDRWFTGYDLAKRLLKEHRLTLVGTIRSNKRELPVELIQGKNRKVNSSIFAFNKLMMVVSYVPKKSKNVLLVSTMHNDNVIDKNSGEKAKPELITFYNATKGGVDVVDRMVSSYNVARNTRRWPMVIFYGLLNVAAINAFVIYRANIPDGEFSNNRRLFLKKLGFDLLKDHLAERAASKYLPRNVRQSASRLAGLPPPDDQPEPPPNKRGYCKYCKKRKTRYFCKFCKAWLCMHHIVACCIDCTEKKLG